MADQIDLFASRYQGGPVREDVLDIIYQITPEDTPFFNMIGDAEAQNVQHQWTTRELTTRGDNAQVEGDQYDVTDFSQPNLPTRLTNFCQILRKTPRVTRTMQRVSTVAIDDLMSDQIAIRSVEWKTDVEHALLRGSLHSGPANSTDTTARRLGGFGDRTNIITDGTLLSDQSLNEARFNDISQRGYNRGARFGDVLVNATLKRVISTFTGASTKFIFSEDRRIVNSVAVYENDFGLQTIQLSRDLLDTTGNDGRALYAFDRSFFAKAWLERPFTEQLPRTGDDFKAVILGEVTLEYGHPGAAEHVTSLTTVP